MHQLFADKKLDAGHNFSCSRRIVSNVCFSDVVEYVHAKIDSEYVSIFPKHRC